PPLDVGRDVHGEIDVSPDVPPGMKRNLAYGRVRSILPYSVQDGYTRQRDVRPFKVAVLENETLRATFLLEYGGRLWSNPVFQPANLAIRNAWFAGGVEWNIGTIGHSPFTCSAVFAARVATPEGTPALRLYEFERIRAVPFQVDAYLPDGSPVLFVRVKIVNPHQSTVPMYWWSNIAVRESPEVRVIVPAQKAYRFGYGREKLRLMSIPEISGTDVTYSTNINRSADFFFHIDEGRRPWIAALDGEGRGLVQTSTSLLKGRKLFVWGTGPGGKNWQSFLSQPGHAYIEIQAGLARTQMEHLPMPPGEWSWLEAYGLLEADAGAVHGRDWPAACSAVEDALEELVRRAEVDREYELAESWADAAPDEVIQQGSGWGALDELRRRAAAEPSHARSATPFDESSLGPQQAPWRALLEDGVMPAPDTDDLPGGFLVDAAWRRLLERSLERPGGDGWLAWLHVGLMRYADGEREAAVAAWEESLARRRTPWALRNLAVARAQDGSPSDGAGLVAEALALAPGLSGLAAECGAMMLDAGKASEWLELLDSLPPEVRARGRIRLLEGRGLLATGSLDEVRKLLDGPIVIDNLREGENSFTDLWYAYHETRLGSAESAPVTEELKARVRREFPPPLRMDFRMATEDAVRLDGR
ncbi:MAG: DUF5107 domain-containing protein, partial [Planctomycetota bacterium]